MTDPLRRNRLAEEGSPYLTQHKDNPVNWQPWDETALEAAKAQNKPIFLSIGYSACHWCHVMEEESFADDAVAERLNEDFIPIKVDREERPDIDSIYMSICQRVTGRGGWPLTAWLTPEGSPFYIGTYFPKEPQGQMPGLLDLLDKIAASWNDPEERSEMQTRAEQWVDTARDKYDTPDADGTGEVPGDDTLDSAVRTALRSVDDAYGGFGSDGPKFPQPGRLDLLLRTAGRSGTTDALTAVTATLDAMADGGMYDHLGGGFHRYATDREWTVPHFEKMLYDNAGLPPLYLAGHQLTGDEGYAETVDETLAFVERELTHPDGGFYSTLDARSGDEEGSFYVWTPADVHAHLDDPAATLFCERYGVTDGGNFERGTTVLNVSTTIDTLADDHDLTTDVVTTKLSNACDTLFAAREERTRPPRDEKILAGWNGMMISAYADAARILDADYAGPARDALDFVTDHLLDNETGRLQRRFIDGDVAGEGYLEDYAFLARGAFDLYQATGDLQPLSVALNLAETIVSAFWDAETKTIYFTPDDGEELVTRPQELTDSSTPSSLGATVDLLCELDGFVADADYREIAGEVLATHSNRITGNPLQHVSLTLAADRYTNGGAELTVAADDLPTDWRETLADRYLPGVTLAHRPPTESELQAWLDELGLEAAPPVWADREAIDGEPTVYACESFTCSPPQTALEPALEWLETNR
ncbi:thioredoxin domain-containing protein [Halonotius pteroides]|uniref:Thioredoxin domain-containing protein n=1 Tax=Halonotius pteroides TaxID=268735 RepID=A0A3A6QT70_9EURY|nr:thioredoxin domain-containing protein [Halonotius pteroides]RJX51839.1 thioredoxin domain-containing protein [Halonotius pteroides]